MTEGNAWLMLVAVAAATYAWRGLGVALSGRIDPEGPTVRWIGAIAYAMLAGLVARMIVMPLGPLAATSAYDRLGAALAAAAIFFLTRRNLLLGVVIGAATLVLLTLARATR